MQANKSAKNQGVTKCKYEYQKKKLLRELRMKKTGIMI